MIDEQARALLIVGALLSGASGSLGYVGGRMTAPAPEPEVRFVHIPMPAIVAPQIDVAPVEPPPGPASPPPAAVPPDPEPAAAAPASEPKPLPRPRPKAEAKPKPRPEKRVAAHSTRGMPSCAVVKREYDAMSWPERMAAYRKATPEEVAHGKRCLGL